LGNSTIAMVLLLVTAAVVLNLFASACSMQSFVYSASQKALQLALVWTVPFVGAILVLSVWAYDRKFAVHDPDRLDEGPWPPGIGPEKDQGHHSDTLEDGGSHEGHLQ
jgi:hypothetical protein